MNKIDHAEKLLQLTEEGTSPFHVTASVERQLQEAGFKKVQLGKNWKLEKGGRYYLVHHGTSLVAFAIGKCYRTGDAFRMAAAHTDFPGLRIKPSPEVKKAGLPPAQCGDLRRRHFKYLAGSSPVCFWTGGAAKRRRLPSPDALSGL